MDTIPPKPASKKIGPEKWQAARKGLLKLSKLVNVDLRNLDRLKIEDPEYLSELINEKFIRLDKVRKVPKVPQEKLPEYQLVVQEGKLKFFNHSGAKEFLQRNMGHTSYGSEMNYRDADKIFKSRHSRLTSGEDLSNEIPYTFGNVSKGKSGVQSFILTASDEIYMFKHFDGDSTDVHISHASLSHGKPVKFAGMLGINAEGQISELNDSTGHYKSDELSMERAIEFFEKNKCISEDCKITTQEDSSRSRLQRTVAEFKDYMNEVIEPGKTRSESMKDQKHVTYAQKKAIRIGCQETAKSRASTHPLITNPDPLKGRTR